MIEENSPVIENIENREEEKVVLEGEEKKVESEEVKLAPSKKRPRTDAQRAALLKAREKLNEKRKKTKEIDEELKKLKLKEENELMQENQRLRELLAAKNQPEPEEPEVAEEIEKPREEVVAPQQKMDPLQVMQRLGF